MAAILIDNLTKRFGSTTAVQNLSFEVQSGRITGFLGPNGAGKSTTMRCLLGLVHPSSGEATIGGRTYHDLEHPARTVGALLEDPGFYPGRSGRDHLRIMARFARSDVARVDELLEQVGLADAAKRKVDGYSLGMKQRLGIAGALIADPQVLILDEPGNGLDPAGIRWLRELLRERAAAGAAVLVSSHVLAEISELADDVVIVRGGRLVAEGSVQELLEGSGARSRVRSSDNGRLKSLLEQQGHEVQADADLLMTSATPEDVGDLASPSGIAIYALSSERRSLENVFLEMTADAEGEGRR